MTDSDFKKEMDGLMSRFSELSNQWNKISSPKKPEVVEKDWEIVKMVRNGKIHDKNKFCNKDCDIFSVKRLSDQETFSVGDINEYPTGLKEKISGFKIVGSDMFFKTFPGEMFAHIRTAKKLPTPTKTFEWTDELVLDFRFQSTICKEPSPQKFLKQFKASKQRIEIVGYANDKEPYNGKHANVLKIYYPYSFSYENGAMKEKFPLIKSAIEKILNNETT